MTDYQIDIKIFGTFPEELKPQITKEIRVLKEYESLDVNSKTNDKPMFYSLMGVNVTSENDIAARDLAAKKLNELLGFYSLTTFNHFRIIHDENHAMGVTHLTGSREPTQVFKVEYGIQDINGDIFSKNVFPYFNILQEEKNQYIKNAIEFLRKGRFERSREVSLILSMIALEALFSKTTENTEIGFRLSNRTAVLLGSNKNERIELRKELRNLYDARSKIVHGKALEEIDLGGIFIWTREAILRFMMLTKKYPDHDSILEKLDNGMIDNEILDELKNESSELLNFTENNYWSSPEFRVLAGNEAAKMKRVDHKLDKS